MVISFRPRSNGGKKADGSRDEHKRRTVYVWLASNKAVFLIAGEPKESKYSYGVPIIPLFGRYHSTKDGKTYDASALSDYNVVLNIPKGQSLDVLKGKKVVVVGFDESEVFVVKNEENEGGEGKR